MSAKILTAGQKVEVDIHTYIRRENSYIQIHVAGVL